MVLPFNDNPSSSLSMLKIHIISTHLMVRAPRLLAMFSRAMTMALKGHNKFCFVDESLPMPNVAHPNHARWHRVNNMVMSWILNSIHSSLANTILYATDAASAWTNLQERFSTANGPHIYEIEKRIATFSQRDESIADYHNHLSALWDELNLLDPPSKCPCSARQEYVAQMESH
nr:uncharacterized protein LOC109158415 [Ipomoea batatas]